MRKSRLTSLRALSLPLAAAAILGGTHSSSQAADKTVISVAYSETYVFDTEDFTKKWWGGIKTQFEKQHPDVTVQLVPIQGGYDDIVNKLALLYRSPSTAPDIAQMATPTVDRFASSGYLLPLDKYLATTDWWNKFPPAIQSEGAWQGKTYSVNTGENDSMIYYNISLFKKAGLPVPWKPTTWNDILAAGRVIKAKVPDVVPIWLLAGTGSGDNTVLMGVDTLLSGSSTPTIFDTKTQKWVVDSPGLREVFGFYRSIFSEKMGAKLSDLFSTAGVTAPVFMIPKNQIAITFGSNFYGGNWSKLICTPCWAQASQIAGVTPVPTVNGKAPGVASTIGGWDLTVSATTKNPDLTWQLLQLMESKENQIDAANWAGFVPGDADYVKDPTFIQFAAPYNEVSAQVLPDGAIEPANGDYLVWSRGAQEATGALAQHPDTTVDDAIGILTNYVNNQLDPSQTETLK
jgi:multiple sugar transport system substrate-binding protein